MVGQPPRRERRATRARKSRRCHGVNRRRERSTSRALGGSAMPRHLPRSFVLRSRRRRADLRRPSCIPHDAETAAATARRSATRRPRPTPHPPMAGSPRSRGSPHPARAAASPRSRDRRRVIRRRTHLKMASALGRATEARRKPPLVDADRGQRRDDDRGARRGRDQRRRDGAGALRRRRERRPEVVTRSGNEGGWVVLASQAPMDRSRGTQLNTSSAAVACHRASPSPRKATSSSRVRPRSRRRGDRVRVRRFRAPSHGSDGAVASSASFEVAVDVLSSIPPPSRRRQARRGDGPHGSVGSARTRSRRPARATASSRISTRRWVSHRRPIATAASDGAARSRPTAQVTSGCAVLGMAGTVAGTPPGRTVARLVREDGSLAWEARELRWTRRDRADGDRGGPLDLAFGGGAGIDGTSGSATRSTTQSGATIQCAGAP